MAGFSLKNRIALHYLLGTALVVFVVFVVIYLVVSASVNVEINRTLALEVTNHQHEAAVRTDTTRLVDPDEWEESEHNDLNVYPIFVEIYDRNGRPREKSPNLKSSRLSLQQHSKEKYHNLALGGISIRQTQTELYNKGHFVGYAVIAMSTEQQKRVLDSLLVILSITFPLTLLMLYVISAYLAGKSIRPVNDIIDTTGRISEGNFDQRIALPPNRDELYTLSSAINKLLDRIEKAIEREKQFTSDASHELRTPLAVVKGTLEVLVRKPRDTAEYEEKIKYCIGEVDRLNRLVDQLLMLARFENHRAEITKSELALTEIIMESLERYSSKIAGQNLSIDFTFDRHFYIHSDGYLVSVIVTNLLSNALKYSNPGGLVKIILSEDDEGVTCSFIDIGIGIAEADLDKIFDQFFRSQPTERQDIKGTGLGLSLVKRLCDLLGVGLNVTSKQGKGTTATLLFPKN